MKLSIEHTGRPKVGESVSGDIAFVRSEGDQTLFALIDGLGHGPAANQVALEAVAFLSQAPLTPDARVLMLGLHEALGAGRGAAATLCCFDGQILQAIGVGNVELRSASSRVGFMCSPGIVGKQLRLGNALSTKLRTGDRVVLFSDGLSSRLALEPVRQLKTRQAADGLLEQFGRTNDDATVLVADVE